MHLQKCLTFGVHINDRGLIDFRSVQQTGGTQLIDIRPQGRMMGAPGVGTLVGEIGHIVVHGAEAVDAGTKYGDIQTMRALFHKA